MNESEDIKNKSDEMSDILRQSIKHYKEIVESDEDFTEKGEAWYMMGQALSLIHI